MSGVALGVAVVGAYGSERQRQASQDAQDQQMQAGQNALTLQGQQYGYSQNQMYPWLQAGQAALEEQRALMGLGGDTEGALAALRSSPGYQSGLQQGERSVAASSAARGGMGSGKALTAANKWGQDYATGQYNNRLSQLSSLSGVGESTATGLASDAMDYGKSAGGYMTGIGDIGAAGTMNRSELNASTLTGLLNTGLRGYQNYNQPSYRENTYDNLSLDDWANNPYYRG